MNGYQYLGRSKLCQIKIRFYIEQRFTILNMKHFMDEKCRVGISFIGFSSKSLVFCEQKSDSLVKKSKLLLSLFCHERPEQIAHGCSFVKSDKSALFNMSNFERKSEFPTLKKCKTILLSYCSNLLNSNNKLAQKSISWSSFKRLRFFHFLNSLHRTCSHIVWFWQLHMSFLSERQWVSLYVSSLLTYPVSDMPRLQNSTRQHVM